MLELFQILTVGERDDILRKIVDHSANGQSVVIVNFLNAHAVNLASSDLKFNAAIHDSDFLLRDGVAVELAMKTHGLVVGDNLNGTDFIPHMLASGFFKRLVILGSTDDVLKKAADKIKSDYKVELVGMLNGFDHDFEQYSNFACQAKCDLVLLAMGMPKQELLASFIKSNAGPQDSFCIVSGGAVLSFITGEEVRAPSIVRKVKMEWMWRMMMDPARLWRRYILGAVTFFGLLVRSMLSAKRNT